jgi:hypothetical protein
LEKTFARGSKIRMNPKFCITVWNLFPINFQNPDTLMAHTLVSERAAQAAATPATAPVAAGLHVTELPVAVPPVADPPRHNRLPTAHYKPEAVIKRKAHSKARAKTAKVGVVFVASMR